MSQQPKIGSMFSGYGGLDMAVESVTGATPAWFVEFDAAPSKILKHHWPDVPNYGDVTSVDWATVPRVDILIGGTPCQDLSHAGKRAGMTEGTRSNLWVNMREAIIHLNPQLVVWENVLGALSATATSDSDMEQDGRQVGDGGGGHLRALGRVLGDLAEIGFDATWTTLRASDVGAPHHRARVFLIAWPSDSVLHPGHDAGCPELGEQHEVPASGSRESSQDPADSHGFGLETGRQPRRPGAEIPQPHRRLHPLPHSISSGRNERRRTAPGEAQGRGAHSESDGRGAGVQWGQYAPAVRRWERIVGPAPAPTEPNSKGKPRLNAAFAEWMMGLPAGWITGVPGLSRADQLKAAGNGVVPQQAAAALIQLLAMNNMGVTA